MKKFLVSLCLIILMVTTMFTGCSLVTRNNASYYNQIVASAGDITVTMQELIYGYNSFGYDYVKSEGMKEKESVIKTLNEIINKKLFLKHFSDDETFSLNPSELNKVKEDTYKSINSAIESYETEIRKELGISKASFSDSAQNDSEESYLYSKYDEKITFNNDAGKFVYNNEFTSSVIKNPGNFVFTSVERDDIKAEARTRYFASLRNSAKTLGKTILSNDALLKDEIDRVYDIYYENVVITKINNIYIQNSQSDEVVETINDRIYELLGKYVSKEKTTLQLKGVTNTSIGGLTVSDVEKLYFYTPTIVKNNFFKVAHILIPFDEESDIDTDGMTEVERNAYLASKKADVKVQGRDETTGIKTDEEISAGEILTELQGKFATATNEQKEVIFREAMYKYSSDTATFSADTNYIIPKNPSLDTMVEPFATESRRLYNNGSGEKYSLSNITTSDYGCHIIMYLGQVGAVIDETTDINETNKLDLLINLYNYKLKSGDNKSVYHYLFDLISGEQTTFETYFSNVVAYEKHGLKEANIKIKIYNSKIKSLWS